MKVSTQNNSACTFVAIGSVPSSERDGGGTNEMDDGHIEIPEKDVFAGCSLCEQLLPLHHPPAQAPSKMSLWKPACTLTPQPTWT